MKEEKGKQKEKVSPLSFILYTRTSKKHPNIFIAECYLSSTLALQSGHLVVAPEQSIYLFILKEEGGGVPTLYFKTGKAR